MRRLIFALALSVIGACAYANWPTVTIQTSTLGRHGLLRSGVSASVASTGTAVGNHYDDFLSTATFVANWTMQNTDFAVATATIDSAGTGTLSIAYYTMFTNGQWKNPKVLSPAFGGDFDVTAIGYGDSWAYARSRQRTRRRRVRLGWPARRS